MSKNEKARKGRRPKPRRPTSRSGSKSKAQVPAESALGSVNTVENTVQASAVPPATRPGLNGGALQTGNPGNAGGTGRPPNIVRELALEMFANRLPRLDKIAAGENVRARVGDKARSLPASIREQRAAIVDLGRLGGMATKIELDAPVTPFVVGVLRGPDALPPAPPPGGSNVPLP